MIDPKADDVELLREARNLFEASSDHYEDCNDERRVCARAAHNTAMEGQWPEEVIEELRRQKRPFWSFNMIHGKVHTFLGMQRDARRVPKVRPEGAEDRFLAGTLATISEKIRKKGKANRADGMVLKNGAIRGEGDGQIYVDHDPVHPGWIDIGYKNLKPEQVKWDPAAVDHDRSDARYVSVDTWLDETEFGQRYPDHRKHFQTLRKGSLTGDISTLSYDHEHIVGHEDRDVYSPVRCDKYYFDQKRKLIRVVAMEYKTPVKVYHFVSQETGEAKRIDEMEFSDEAGQPMTTEQKAEVLPIMFPGGRVFVSHIDDIYWIHFVGSTILFNGKSPMPFDGFSVVPFVFYLDDDSNHPYGLVRNLIDPQTQVNKSYCMNIEMGMNQAKPGIYIEEGAVDDVGVLQEQIQTGGSVAVVNDDAIALNRIKDRMIPQPSAAAQQRIENDVKLMDRVSSMFPENDIQSAQVEAALTHLLRDNKAKMVHQEPIESFEGYQTEMEKKIIQAIVREMPEQQIAHLLGNSEKYQVQKSEQGLIILETEVDPNNPQAGPQIKNQASIQKLKTLETDIELEASSDNTTRQAIELGLLLQIKSADVPVPPSLFLEKGITNRADQETAKQFAEQAMKSQSEQAERDSKRLDMEIQTALETEKMKTAEVSRHNKAKEILESQKLQSGALTDFMTIWERADEFEKKTISELMNTRQGGPGGQSAPVGQA